MRYIILLVVLFASPVFAQQTIGDAIKSADISDILEPKWSEMTPAQRLRKCRTNMTTADIVSAQIPEMVEEKEFDKAWRASEVAFRYLTLSMGCDDEQLNQSLRERFDQNVEIDRVISCAHHVHQATSAFTRSNLAIEYFEDTAQAARHAGQSVFWYGEAVRFCDGEQKRVAEDILAEVTKLEQMLLENQEQEELRASGN